MLYLDLSELDRVFHGTSLWQVGRSAPASFRESDHYAEPGLGLVDSIRRLAERETGRTHSGPIRLLTHLRYFGYVFNPVSFFYLFDEVSGRLETIIAEVANTPWNERHMYVLDVAGKGTPSGGRQLFSFPKAFHVSPFMPLDQWYEWGFSSPDDKVSVHMTNLREGRRVFDATLLLQREEISPSRLRLLLLQQPMMCGKVIVAIYWNALLLWLKGAPFHQHPGGRKPTPRTIGRD